MIPLTVAAGIEVHQIIGISVLVITVLSWFVNYIQGNTPDGTPRPQRPKPKPQTTRSEIEELLQELSGERRRPKPEQREQPPRPPKPQPERARAKPKPTPQKPGNLSTAPALRSTARVSNSALSSTNLGEGLRSHQLGSQIDVDVQKQVATVQHDLGNRIAPAAPPQEPQLHPLVKILRDPNGMRQAVLLNEILQGPRSSRREHHV